MFKSKQNFKKLETKQRKIGRQASSKKVTNDWEG
jgi:hypothetical protein